MGYFHFTCEHRAAKIGATGTLQPHPQVALARVPLIWFTGSRYAAREALGLTSTTLKCDRMEHLYEVVDEDLELVHTWAALKREPWFEPFLPYAQYLEAVRGTLPVLWGVATQPVRVTRVR